MLRDAQLASTTRGNKRGEIYKVTTIKPGKP
jgi:hypothetical protein